MSRTVLPYKVNGLVQMGQGFYWRIEDQSANPYVSRPAALVGANNLDPLASAELAQVVCEALNSHHAQMLLKLAMVEGGE